MNGLIILKQFLKHMLLQINMYFGCIKYIINFFNKFRNIVRIPMILLLSVLFNNKFYIFIKYFYVRTTCHMKVFVNGNFPVCWLVLSLLLEVSIEKCLNHFPCYPIGSYTLSDFLWEIKYHCNNAILLADSFFLST